MGQELEASNGGRDLEPSAPVPTGSMLNFIATALRDPNIDVAKLEALLRMQREVMAEDAKAQFNQAFIRLQSKLPRIKKTGVLEYPVDKNKPDGPKRQISKFAKWEDIDSVIRPLLDEEGFALSFNTSPRVGEGGGLLVTAILRHRAGHSQETAIPVPLDTSGGKNNLQGYGSTLSYGKRYAATAALNIIAEGEDDDGKLGGTKFVTTEQAAEIDLLITETGADRGKFLHFYGIADVRNLLEAEFTAAKNALLSKKKQQGAKP
jgi:hypothetical protein